MVMKVQMEGSIILLAVKLLYFQKLFKNVENGCWWNRTNNSST